MRNLWNKISKYLNVVLESMRDEIQEGGVI